VALVSLRHDPLRVDELIAATAGPDHGGIAVFIGTTRRDADRTEVVALEYEAYEELALAELEAVAAEAEALGARVAISHRLGRVAVGEASIAIVAAAAHRPAAFAACRLAIDEAKRRAPIWKRTVHADGTAVWRDGVSAPVS